MFSHIEDYDSLFSLESLNAKISGDLQIKAMINEEQKVPKQRRKIKKQNETTYTNYANSPDVICSIQNYPKLLNFLIYIRRPSIPNVFMYFEGESNLVFVVSSITAYPIVIVKFPIVYPYIYVKTNEMCFDMPLKTLNQFIDRIDKITYQFELTLKYENDKKILEYKSSNLNKIQTTENLTCVNKSAMLNEIFFNKIQNNDLFESDIGLDINYEDELNSMPIYIIGESKMNANINKQLSESMVQKLIVTDDSVSLFQRINLNEQTQTIINRYSKTNYVYWDSSFEAKELNMIKYNSIFKSYDKLINNNDYVYFLICGWREYLQTKTYLFIKIITNADINKENIGSFGDLFMGVDKIMEIYLCHTM